MLDYTEEEFEERLEERLKVLTFGKTKMKNPHYAFLLGGQAGAGKTTLHSIINQELNNDVIIIDNDSFKRFHPRYEELQKQLGKNVTQAVTPFSNKMTESLIEKLSDEGYNLVIEGTLRTVETPKNTALLLQKKGYITDLYMMAVSFEESYLSTLERYERMTELDPLTARFTPKNIQLEMIDSIPKNLEKLYNQQIFNVIKLYNREQQLLYSSETTPDKNPKEIFLQQLNKKLPFENKKEKIQKIISLMNKNGHTEMKEYSDLVQENLGGCLDNKSEQSPKKKLYSNKQKI